MSDRRCPYCQQVFQPARYHPQQVVCSQPACQRQRRRDYQRQKIASDPVYRQVSLDSSQKWRRAHPGYWKQYRQHHPEQAERNRQRQQRRDQKRRLLNLANNNLALDLKPVFTMESECRMTCKLLHANEVGDARAVFCA